MIYAGNSLVVSVDGVVDPINGAPVDNASITVTVKDGAGTVIGSDTMAAVGGGSYRGVVTPASGFVAGSNYTWIVDGTATVTGNRTLKIYWEATETAQTRAS